MKISSCLAIAVLAGTVLATDAFAQKGVLAAPKNRQRPTASLMTGATVRYPQEFRKVAMVNNQLVPLGPWMTYTVPVTDVGTPTICWDAYHDQGGHAPNTAPETGRWLFSWTTTPTPQYDYTEAGFAIPVNNILPGAAAVGAKYFDFLAYDKAGGLQFTTIFTTESYSDTTPPDASWGPFPGWQFSYAAAAPGSFFYYPTNLADPNVWQLPSDGNGGVIVKTTRDAAGTVPAQLYQFAMWGTQEHTTPPPSPAKVGTSGPNMWDDESTGAVCAGGLATNIADGAFQLACENATWDFGAAYQPEPFTFCADIGYDAPAVVACYANCDHSTSSPLLTANDFQCFLNEYAAATAYANCDGSTSVPLLTANDFQCFLNAYAGGCS